MLAIIEIDPNDKSVKSVKFSTNLAEVDSVHNVHMINITEPYGDTTPSNSFIDNISLLMNNPQALTIQSTTGTRDDLNAGSYIDGLLDARTYDVQPFARELSQEDKDSISVRPAAHRAGQTSFFGNI